MAATLEKRTGKKSTTYHVVISHGRRKQRKSYGTDKRAAEAALRAVNKRLREGTLGLAAKPTGPTLATYARVFLAEDTENLATRTRQGLESYLRRGGPLEELLDKRLDELTAPLLRTWYAGTQSKATSTRKHYLGAVSVVLSYAVDQGLIESNPCGPVYEGIGRRRKTAKGRAETATSSARPLEDPGEIVRLVAAAKADARPRTYPVVLCLLDGGLRFGEARGLRWGDVAWGDAQGQGRHLLIQRNIPSGLTEPNPTKSGRPREVALSRRLRQALLEWRMAEGQPEVEAFIFPGLEDSNFRGREWARLCGKQGAGIGKRAMKDLRDTFASQLLTLGVQLGYVSVQLGHADVAITARHYARWAGGTTYRAPFHLEPGEVPADFLTRLESEMAPQQQAQQA